MLLTVRVVDPYELKLDLRVACDSTESAELLWESIVAGLPDGVLLEGGLVTLMDRAQVVPGSALDRQLSSAG